MKNPKSILITGASSGIGAALATEYAADGVTLYLSGRNEERLNDIKSACASKGATVNTKIIDVTEKQAMQDWISSIPHLDIVIANAGISSGVGGDIREIFSTNVDGVFNTVEPALETMKQKGRGQIAIVSSIAGFRGLPSSPAYSASKSAVKAYGEALRGQYHDQNIQINVICPGFVRSHITDQNNFKMPFFMEADKAAKIIRAGLSKDKGLITFPWQMKLITSFVFNLIPEFLLEKILRKLPSK
ncbi:SDR family NAD(P)-dependent oxidoreductase [Pseudemcibacter aquimaris]|uniref:SDR family NAD(P)-dependent oxidoreductase n=1 Tax=Pseudemcibacter aquimaris TaxID=2857064 RepID=UPI002010F82F|nr:SDR family NAD(P)-dependent oxidoreductase [Pseudemcibacter aquimaris]MCC3859966.1 SDR family NAD(P)-dependent oxidoreductase [Pseudemcibacter aquimaris]WDU57298.1 SDR family NAD(P)-dependent oxidoreductase [Pseudemcibacter aquimaris]